MDDQLLREFLAEAEDLIEVLFGDIQTLRARHTEGRARRELIARIFRHVHTIKGSAAAAGLDATGTLAHEFESLLDAARMGRVTLEPAVLDAFDDAVSALARGLSAVARSELSETPHALVERVRRLARGDAERTAMGRASASVLDALPAEIGAMLSEYESHRLDEAVREGAALFVVSVDFDLTTFDDNFRNLSDALAEGGEVISTLPGMEASTPDSVNFRILYATAEERESVVNRIAPFGATLSETKRDDESAAGAANPVDADAATGGVEDAASSNVMSQSATSLTMTVRVPLDELDDLISAAHELFADTVASLDLALASDMARAERTEMEVRAARIRRRFFELEERLIDLRMVPVGQTLERAARAGLNAARVMGREVGFETAGGDVRLDKSLVEAIADPLVHLLRNAVDHGIEPPAERRLAGKSERGVVRLAAVAEGSRVVIRVTDDGRGIDAERVTRKAIERGVIDADARLTEQQCLRLIFRPGFSTAAELSSVSGRGVGLDVVERAVEQAGGELRVRSRPGAGATFEMRLPTTLALVPSLIVRSADARYCIDAGHIIEAGYVAREDTERIGDAEVVRWRGTLVPLVHLRALLAQEPRAETGDAGRIPVIISRVAGRETDEHDDDAHVRAAVAVDGWDGHSEVLVRGLGRHAARWRGVSGATELRDGTVALMLDLPRLLEMQL